MTSTTDFLSREPGIGGPAVGVLGYFSRYAQARGFRPAWRLAFKVAQRPNRFAAWLEELESYRAQFNLSEAALHSYAISPLRPFLRAGLTFDQRLQITRSHHAAVGAVLPTDVIRNIWALRHTKLGLIEGRPVRLSPFGSALRNICVRAELKSCSCGKRQMVTVISACPCDLLARGNGSDRPSESAAGWRPAREPAGKWQTRDN